MNKEKRILSLENWDRKFIFETFSQRDFPYVGVTTPFCITPLRKKAKEKGWSFYGLMSYGVLMAANAVPEFRRRIEEGKLVEYKELDLSFTVLNQVKNCNFAYVPYIKDCSQFLLAFQEQKLAAECALTPVGENTGACIYVTCTPWFRTTSVIQPVDVGKGDAIPRFGWGKLFEQDGADMIDLTIQAHHGFVDGYHIHLFLQALQEIIEDIKKL